jgi:hypothetical protein
MEFGFSSVLIASIVVYGAGAVVFLGVSRGKITAEI